MATGFDEVEALLEDVANQKRREDEAKRGRNGTSAKNGRGTPPSDRRGGDERDLKRRRSRSRDSHRSRRYDEFDRDRRPGRDNYSGQRSRDRSRSPRRDTFRPSDRGRSGRYFEHSDDRRDDRDRYYRDRDRERGYRRGERRRSSGTPERTKNDNETDGRTVFVQQLANRVEQRDLVKFFNERAGPVSDASVVKDRVSGRSKGVGYVTFKAAETVAKAMELTGQKLVGIPIIVSQTEAEKNRQAKTTDGAGHGNANGIPFHRLYVGNIHFDVTEEEIRAVFSPFGDIEFVTMQRDENGKSKGYGFVQYTRPEDARVALEQLNAFEIAGRSIRVGLGNDKFTPESTAHLLQRFNNQQGSAFSGAGGRGAYAGGTGNYARREKDAKTSASSALDDSDVAGVNFNNFSRDALMKKLARSEDNPGDHADNGKKARPAPPPPAPVVSQKMQFSRCIMVTPMFDPETDTDPNDLKEIEDEIREEAHRSYGNVVHIALDLNSKGDVYIKFDSMDGGKKAIQGLNGRYFAGNMVSAKPMVDGVYNSLYPTAAAV